MRKLYTLLFAAISFNSQAQTNYALTFNGTSNVVNIGTPLATGSSYTKEAWVYLTAGTGPRNIISSQDVPLWVEDGVLRAGQGGIYNLVGDVTMPLNRWVHVAVSSGSGNMKLYRDGIPVASGGTATGVAGYVQQTTYIGSHQGSAAFWQGAIDEVRIWNTVLTDAQIKANMLKGPATNSPNLVAYYKSNEGTGIILTNSSTTGPGPNGNISGATWTASPVGFNANALSLDGTNDYVDIGSGSALKPTTALTHEVWVKATNFAVAGTQQITSNFENGGYGIGLVANNIQWELKSSSLPGGYTVVTYPASSVSNNQWHHIAGTFDGAFMRLYVDGLEVNSVSLGGTGRTIIYNNPGNDMMIGAEASATTAPVAGFYFNGQVDEVRIWNVARTSAQIFATAQKELNVSDAAETNGLVAYYTFNQGITNGNNAALATLSDQKGTANGTLYNFALSGTTSNYVTPPITLIVLPVEYKSFTARTQNKETILQWITSREFNAVEFEVQHSTNGTSFSAIGKVAAAGNSESEKRYLFVHADPAPATNYYRLAQKDVDGKIGYSEIRKLEFIKDIKPFTVQNSVISNGLLKIFVNEPAIISIFSAEGKLLLKKQFTTGTHDIQMSSFAKGMYWLSTKGNLSKVIVN